MAFNEAKVRELAREFIPWFDEDQGPLQFEARDHGDVGSETPGDIDVRAAWAFCREVDKQVPGAKAQYDSADEWVMVDVVDVQVKES